MTLRSWDPGDPLITEEDWDQLVVDLQDTSDGHDHDGVNSKKISAGSGVLPQTETFDGSDASGSNGEQNRVITLTNTKLSNNELVVISGRVLHPTHEYTVSHASASSTITVLTELFNSEKIMVKYFV